MSNTENNNVEPTEYNPGSNPWRIAKGTVCRGREEDGTLEIAKSVQGELLWSTISEGFNKESGEPYRYVKCALKTKSGTEIVHVNTTSKTASAGLAGSLALVKKGDHLAISARLGSKKIGTGSKSSYPTYCNVAVWNGTGWVEARPEFNPDFEDCIHGIQSCDHYRAPDDGVDDDDAWESLCAWADKKGWLSGEHTEAAYFEVMNTVLKAMKEPLIPLTDDGKPRFPKESVEKVFFESMKDKKEMPKAIAALDVFADDHASDSVGDVLSAL